MVELKNDRPNTAKPSRAKAPAFMSQARFEAKHPDALAIYCSDGRFTDSVEELLHALGHARLDTLTMPGGPGLLNFWSASYADREALSRGASFLIQKHGIKRVVLLAHEGCGFYKQLCSSQPVDAPRRQVEDLAIARDWLKREFPHVDVSLFYARVAEGRVAFDRLG